MRLRTDVPRDVFAMAAVSFCVALGFGVVAPAIPLFARQFGVGATAAGAVVSAFALMRFVSALGAGWLVDRVGERTGLHVGIAVVAVSSLLAGLAQSYPQLLVLRGIGGVGSALFGVAAVGLVLRVAERRIRGRAMSVYRTGFLVGGIVGPALGGVVLGISLRAPFFLYAGTLGLAVVVVLVFVERSARRGVAVGGGRDAGGADDGEAVAATGDAGEPGSDAQAEAEHGSEAAEPSFREVLATPEYQAALVANLAVGLAVLGLRSAVVPLLFVASLGAAPGWVGVAFLVSTVVQTALMFPAGRWSDTAGRRPTLVVGAIVSAVGLGMLGIGGSLAFALVAMAVFGAGSAFLSTVPGALVGDVAGKRSGKVIAVFNMASDLGAVAGPVVAGVLVDRGSFAAAFGLGAAVVVLAAVFGLRIPKRTG